MKIYIKSSLKDKHKSTLDALVDGNKLWNPLTGEYSVIPEETIEEWRNPKPDLIKDLKEDTYHIFKNGKFGWISVNGEHFDNQRPYRNAGRYKIYIDSFGGAQLPQSKVFIADTQTGTVYQTSVIHGTGDFRRDISELVEWFMDGNTL